MSDTDKRDPFEGFEHLVPGMKERKERQDAFAKKVFEMIAPTDTDKAGTEPLKPCPFCGGTDITVLIETTATMGPASQEDALLVARHRQSLLSASPAAAKAQE